MKGIFEFLGLIVMIVVFCFIVFPLDENFEGEKIISADYKREKIVNSFESAEVLTVPEGVKSAVNVGAYEKVNTGDFTIGLSAPYIQNIPCGRYCSDSKYICTHVYIESHVDEDVIIDYKKFKAQFSGESSLRDVIFRPRDTHGLSKYSLDRNTESLYLKQVSVKPQDKVIEEICLIDKSVKSTDISDIDENFVRESDPNAILPKKTQWTFSTEERDVRWDMNDDSQLSGNRKFADKETVYNG